MFYRQKMPNDDNDSKKKISPHTCKKHEHKIYIYIYIYINIYIIYYSYNS